MTTSIEVSRDWVTGSNEVEFVRKIDEMLARGPAVDWRPILTSGGAGRVKDYLVSRKMLIEADLSELAAESAIKQHACLKSGFSGKKEWFDYLAEMIARKRDIVRLKVNIEQVLAQAKRVIAPANVAMTSEASDLRATLEKVSRAILEHKESMEWSSNKATIADRALWSVLDRAAMPKGRGETFYVREWLNQIDRRRG